MNKYTATQSFTMLIAVILGIVFYATLLAGTVAQYQQYMSMMVPMLLVINAIILLGIFSLLVNVIQHMDRPARNQRKKH